MGFMDKVKQAAQDVGAEAKKATAQGKEKLEQAQTKRKMDGAAQRLGYLIYAERTKNEGDAAAIEAAIAEISGFEKQLDAGDDGASEA